MLKITKSQCLSSTEIQGQTGLQIIERPDGLRGARVAPENWESSLQDTVFVRCMLLNGVPCYRFLHFIFTPICILDLNCEAVAVYINDLRWFWSFGFKTS